MSFHEPIRRGALVKATRELGCYAGKGREWKKVPADSVLLVLASMHYEQLEIVDVYCLFDEKRLLASVKCFMSPDSLGLKYEGLEVVVP